MRRFLSCLVSLSFIASTAGCTAPEPIPMPEPAEISRPAPLPVPRASGLIGGEWTVKSIDGAAIEGATIRFGQDGSFSGRAPCNRYSGEAAISTNEIAFSPAVSTRMTCALQVMAAEKVFFEITGGIVQWSLSEDDVLILRSRTGKLVARR